jgi:hypothetical protein
MYLRMAGNIQDAMIQDIVQNSYKPCMDNKVYSEALQPNRDDYYVQYHSG